MELKIKTVIFISVPIFLIFSLLYLLYIYNNNFSILSTLLFNDNKLKDEINFNNDVTQQGKQVPEDTKSNEEDGTEQQIPEKYINHLCGTTFPKSTYFIKEYSIPYFCSQPVGIAVNTSQENDQTNEYQKSNETIWIAATWTGHLILFDPEKGYFSEFIEIPNWKTEDVFGSMVWDMKFDKNGDLWFTDQVNNAIWRYFVTDKKFEMYKIPTRGSYPSSITFDSQDRVWFSEIFGKKLGMLIPSKAENNTTKGIIEYDFKDKIAQKFVTMGPLTISKNETTTNINNNSFTINTDDRPEVKYKKDQKRSNEIIWFSTMDYPEVGSIVRFDINTKEFDVFELPENTGIPVGIVEDDQGRLWINDHATNLFFMLDPSTKNTKQFSTSLPSTRNSTTTLPYFNELRDKRLWFNEHEGNAIAYFDTENNTLVEYHIPTRSKIWGNTSNPLKFAIDSKGSIWFTEWTENKLGLLESSKIDKLPITMNVSKDKIILDTSKSNKGDFVDILINHNIQIKNNNKSRDIFETNLESNKLIKMIVSSSLSKSGKLWNVTGTFSDSNFFISEISESIDIQANESEQKKEQEKPFKKIRLELKPHEVLVPGNYTLTISARYDNTITLSKIIDLVVLR